MHFTSFLEEGRLTVALTGEIDHHCAKAYIQAISAKIEAYTPEVCVLDFQEVSFVDSSGIAVVIIRGGYTTVPAEDLGADRVLETLEQLPEAFETLNEPRD